MFRERTLRDHFQRFGEIDVDHELAGNAFEIGCQRPRIEVMCSQTAGDPPVVLASLGYIVIAADYVGYGVSAAAPHPYLLSAPSASAVVDLMTAAKYWRQVQHVPDNKQLFLTGYSEGGYVTMATHRALQAGTSPHRNELVRVVAGAGRYTSGRPWNGCWPSSARPILRWACCSIRDSCASWATRTGATRAICS